MSSVSGGLPSISEALENSFNLEDIGGLECKERRLERNFNLDHQSDGKLIERQGGCHCDHLHLKKKCSSWQAETGLEWSKSGCFRSLAR